MEKKKKRQEIFGAFWSNLEIRDSDGNLLESIDIEDETVNYIKNITNGLGKVDTHFISDVYHQL